MPTPQAKPSRAKAGAARKTPAPRSSRSASAKGERGTAREAAKADGSQAGLGSDALERYRLKRDFDTTPEPSGKPTHDDDTGAAAKTRARPAAKRVRKAAAAVPQALSFVIQKHAARRLHYDFRLELDGALKSWAVPKGPSLDPA